jgi:hypothetical protein
MDDYSLASLSESKNEWCARLVNTLTPAVIVGLRSIFDEAWSVCVESDEEDKYLMTFQTFLSRVPKWNQQIVENERKRIEEETSCGYLEELITCVHVIQLKALTCVRVGQKQKKVDIDVPSADQFVHRVYTNVARKLYTNVYLFEKDVTALETQRHNREIEVLIRECIMNAVRDTMPVEAILRAYMDETEERDVDVSEQLLVGPAAGGSTHLAEPAVSPDVALEVAPEVAPAVAPAVAPNIVPEVVPEAAPDVTPDVAGSGAAPRNTAPTLASETLTFANDDQAVSVEGVVETVEAPKTLERLEQLSAEAAERRQLEEEDDDVITIGESVSLEPGEIASLGESAKTKDPPVLDDIELLEPL